jgi:O-antigen/teichoic acid export membrane protein
VTISARLMSVVQRFARRRFVRDTLILQFGQFAAIVAQGLTSILILRILGPALVGQYALITAMAAVLGLLDLSASGKVALVEVSKALGANDRDEVRDALAYLIRINVQLNGLLVVGFFVLAMPLAQISYNNAEVGLWARWLSLQQLTNLPFSVLTIAYQCQRNMRTLVSLESVRLLLTCAASIGVLLTGWGIPGLVLSQVVISCVYAIYSVVQYSRLAQADSRFPAWSTLLGRAGSVGIRARFGLGFRISAGKNLSSFATQLPTLIIGALYPVATGNPTLGYYSTALKVMTLPQPLVSGIARNLETFLPYRAGQSKQSLRDAFVKTTLYTGLIWSAATIGMAVISPVILLVIAGFDYLPATSLLYPLLLQSLGVGLGVGVGPALRALNKLEYSIGINILMLALSTPIGYVLIANLAGYGGAWFYGLRFLAQTVLEVLVTLWLLRPVKAPEQAA